MFLYRPLDLSQLAAPFGAARQEGPGGPYGVLDAGASSRDRGALLVKYVASTLDLFQTDERCRHRVDLPEQRRQ